MVEETLRESPGLAHKRACAQVGDQLGIPGATLRNWFRTGVAGSRAPRAVVVTDDPAARIAELEKENRQLRRANAILKSASAYVGDPCQEWVSASRRSRLVSYRQSSSMGRAQ